MWFGNLNSSTLKLLSSHQAMATLSEQRVDLNYYSYFSKRRREQRKRSKFICYFHPTRSCCCKIIEQRFHSRIISSYIDQKSVDSFLNSVTLIVFVSLLHSPCHSYTPKKFFDFFQFAFLTNSSTLQLVNVPKDQADIIRNFLDVISKVRQVSRSYHDIPSAICHFHNLTKWICRL